MGADRAVLVTRRGRGRLGSRRHEPRARDGARARGAPTSCSSASRRPTPTAPCSGPPSPSGCACRSSRRSPSSTLDGREGARQAADRVRLRRDRGAAAGRRRRLGRDQRAALPVAQGDHGREEEAAGDALARRPRRRRRARSARRARAPRCSRSNDPPPRGDTREDRGRRLGRAEDRRLPRGEEGCCEHRSSSSSTTTASCRRARSACSRKAASLGGDVAGRAARLRRATGSPPRPARFGAQRGLRRRRRAARGAAAAAARRRARDACSTSSGFDTVLFAASVLAADVAAGLAARLDAGLNWDLIDLARRGRRARRQAAGARRLGLRRRRLDARSRASRSSAPAPSTRRRPAAAPRSTTFGSRSQDFSHGGDDGRAGARGERGPVDRGRRRDRRRRPRPRRPGELHARRGAGEGARRRGRRDARGRRRGLVPVLDAGRPDRQDRLAEALRRRAGSPARSSTRSACRARA